MVSELDIPSCSISTMTTFSAPNWDTCSERKANAQGDDGQKVTWTILEDPGQDSQASQGTLLGLRPWASSRTSVPQFPGGVKWDGGIPV